MAESLSERALKICEKIFGPNHPDTARSLNTLSLATEDTAKAKVLCERGLRIRETMLGAAHPDTAQSLNNLAELYRQTGDYSEAQRLNQRALAIREKALGPNHPETAESLNNLADIYRRTGDYAKAESLNQRGLAIRENVLGLEHPDTAWSLNNLALVYVNTGDYAKAEPLYRRELEVYEKTLGPEHPDTATALHNLAVLYEDMGAYPKAEPLYQRALKICEKVYGPAHSNTAGALHNLALLYDHIGDYLKAESLYQRAVEIYEKAVGPNHPYTANSLDRLGALYIKVGNYSKAEELLKRALHIREKALGPEHPNTATSVNNIAQLYVEMGDYGKAEPLYQRALKVREKALGPEHPHTATSLNNLAQLYVKLGEFAKAEPLYQRALNIREKALGPEHTDTAKSLESLARLYAVDIPDRKRALLLTAQAQRAQEKILSNILSFTSERQRLAYQKTTAPYTLAATLDDAVKLAEIVLSQKGIVLDSLLEDRLAAEASRDPTQRAIIDQLRSAKERLTKVLLEVPKDVSEQARQQRDAEKENLSREVEKLEASLAHEVAGYGKARRALNTTLAQVQSALPEQAALVELIRYSHYLGKDKFEVRYGAMVVGTKGEPHWVALGSASEIEKNVALYQKSVRGKTDEATLSTVLRALEQQIWVPIEKAFPAGINTVILSPDAELCFVSFATLLMPEDRFLGAKYSIRYVASGRDLLEKTKLPEGIKTTMRVFGNPDFGGNTAGPTLAQSNTATLRSVEMRDLQGISLPSLPGTAKELKQLEERAKRLGWQSQTYVGLKATEAELRELASPGVLHLATHGFFLPEIDLGISKGSSDAAEIPDARLVNPMHRSGLALAGAQRTLQAWAKGVVPPIENDGIVTAEEVGGLRLDGTWLVVLSACDTGEGEARAGEGVMGLRRGFIQAGAQNLLMTLWPISDETTVQIMLDFYDAAFKSGNAPQALADTQRNWLVKLRKERGLLPAVQLAGPFIMSSQGKLD